MGTLISEHEILKRIVLKKQKRNLSRLIDFVSNLNPNPKL